MMDTKSNKAQEESWRIFRIMAEFIEGFEHLGSMGPLVTIFGSARSKPSNRYYKLTVKTAQLLAKSGYGVVSGGGPGIMEAANKGATLGGGESIGLNIILPHEQFSNEYVKTAINFHYFFVRKVMFIKYTQGVIIMPGGFGTMDEFCEVLTLLQTDKIHRFPLVLMGTDYWAGFLEWVSSAMIKEKFISKKDMELLTITDDPEVAVDAIASFNVNVGMPLVNGMVKKWDTK